MQNILNIALDIDRIANIKCRLTDLKNNMHVLKGLNDALSFGRLIDPMQDARESLFRGKGSDEFPMEVNSELGKNVFVTGSPASSFRGCYISRTDGMSRTLQIKNTDPNTSEWFGLELESDDYIVEKISDVYVFMKLASDYQINVWIAAFLSQGSQTTRVDLKNMEFDRNTRHAMLTENFSRICDNSKEKTKIRLGCYFPTSIIYELTVLDIRFLCTL